MTLHGPISERANRLIGAQAHVASVQGEGTAGHRPWLDPASRPLGEMAIEVHKD